MEVVGFRSYSMTAKETGELLEGVTVFCTAKDEKVTGMAMEKFSLSHEKLRKCNWTPMVGDQIELVYNKYGKVESISQIA